MTLEMAVKVAARFFLKIMSKNGYESTWEMEQGEYWDAGHIKEMIRQVCESDDVTFDALDWTRITCGAESMDYDTFRTMFWFEVTRALEADAKRKVEMKRFQVGEVYEVESYTFNGSSHFYFKVLKRTSKSIRIVNVDLSDGKIDEDSLYTLRIREGWNSEYVMVPDFAFGDKREMSAANKVCNAE